MKHKSDKRRGYHQCI